MNGDAWASLADEFVDGAYATVKGQVRTYVLHQQLADHLLLPPAAVLDVGGGAGVLMYVDDPGPLIGSLCACAAPGGVVSVMALNAETLAVRPALEHRWADALAAFDARREQGVLGVDTRADTVAELEELLRANNAEPEAWYGVWLFTGWTDVAASDPDQVRAVAAVELEASRRDPYGQLSRVFHLVARTRPR
jgi:hypothetical protein